MDSVHFNALVGIWTMYSSKYNSNFIFLIDSCWQINIILIRLSNPTVEMITAYCMDKNTSLFTHSVFIHKQKLYWEDIFLSISAMVSLRIMYILLLSFLLLLSVKNQGYGSQNKADEVDYIHYSLTEICRIKAERRLFKGTL